MSATATLSQHTVTTRTQCPACGGRFSRQHYTFWQCGDCQRQYPCTHGVPRLYLEESIGKSDKELRDRLYNALFGRFYNVMMPFVLLPLLPMRLAFWLWVLYFAVVSCLGLLVYQLVGLIFVRGLGTLGAFDGVAMVLLAVAAATFARHPQLAKLLVLAIPLKISLVLRPFQAAKGIYQIHAEVQEPYRTSAETTRLLDVATGSCNSLLRYRWTRLDGEFVGTDLSETMLLRGMRSMSKRNVPIDFVLAAVQQLPFESETFDVVTCYGAVNAFTGIAASLEEMARVTRPGGRILFMDEQLRDDPSPLERIYFESVLASHDRVHGCPTEMLPASLEDVEVHQVYRFYYVCTARKKADTG